MLDPDALYALAADAHVDGAPVVLEALDGFVDAGGVTRLAREHLLTDAETRVLATFDVDQLFDYRARRPPLVFERDHWASYEAPQLALHAVRDVSGTEYLVLAGPEPDVQWDRFVAAVRSLVARFGVRLVVGLNAIPMAVPHTRPVGLTAHGSRKELVEGYEPWPASVRVPGSASALLEYRLGQAGHDAMGFAVHVPQYLASADLPGSAAVLLDAVSRATGLSLDTAALREAGEVTRSEVDAQVAQAPELAAAVQGLEEQYDAFMAGRARTRLLAEEAGPLPTADELGDELERFLAAQDQDRS